MKPNPDFVNQGQDFWAHVRSLSQTMRYSDRGTHEVKTPTLQEILNAMGQLSLSTAHLLEADGRTASAYANNLVAYFSYRANILNNFVQHQLQTKEQAEAMYLRLSASLQSSLPVTMNKQKGEKATVAYLTGMVNLLVEANAQGIAYDHDPRQLTTITKDGRPLRTLARRVDGAFPSIVNPVAIWEIKEYYHTTTFGSRVSGGVYETLLDGMELEEMRLETGIHVEHVLIVDAHYTWWDCGRAYLCRMVDSLHMGFVDEVLFGKEVEERLPVLVNGWVQKVRARQNSCADNSRPHVEPVSSKQGYAAV